MNNTPKHIALIGPMGAGKSFVGQQLAKQLSLAFVDIDQQIEAAAGMTIPQIFKHHGEAVFRCQEEEALSAALTASTPSVIATGGGAVLAKQNRDLLADCCWVVYLSVSAAIAIERCQSQQPQRPLLEGSNPLAQWEAILQERQPHYAALADVTFDTDHCAAKQLAVDMAAAWEKQHGE